MKKIAAFFSALVLSFSSLFAILTPRAFAATATWDGGGGDDNMTTAANWAGDVAPLAGDDLVFPANVTDRTVVNDFPNATSFNTITFSGAASGASGYTMSGSNTMELVAGMNNSMTGSTSNIVQTVGFPITLTGGQTFQAANGNLLLTAALALGANALTVTPGTGVFFSISGVVTGSGAITKSGAGILDITGNNASYSGAITVSAGTLKAEHNSALGTTAAGTTVNAGGDLQIGNCSDMTVAEDLTLTGDSSDPTDTAKLTAGSGCSGGGANETYGTASVPDVVTLSGDVTLGSNVTFGPLAATTTLTGGLSGSFAISLMAGYDGDLIVNSSPNTSQTANGTLTPPVLEVTLSDSQPTNTVMVVGNTVLTLTGTRGDVTVNAPATLKGTGTAGAVTVNNGAKLAPGLSPGCLDTGDLTLASGSTYDFELGGTEPCTGYDQIRVTGTVNLSGTLTLVRFNDFKPSGGQSFTIISNDGSEAVTGTFTGLAQGATFTVDGYVFAISYTGGDGNDVVVTAQTVPAAPDTGFSLIKNNPLITMAVMIAAAAGIVLAARRSRLIGHRR